VLDWRPRHPFHELVSEMVQSDMAEMARLKLNRQVTAPPHLAGLRAFM
jgi:hypothetical protein